MNNITDFIDKINAIESEKDFYTFFVEVINIFRYECACMIVYNVSPTKPSSLSVFGELSGDIKHSILESNLIKSYCLNESSPISYQRLLFNNHNHEKIVDDQASLIVPINGYGNEFACLFLTIPELTAQAADLEKLGWYWLILSPLIYHKYHKLFKHRHGIGMTKRELECIKWAAEGKTSWEISQLLNISQRTVDFHFANCITKTDSINRQQAIVKCVLNGQLLAF
jgi:DNA-binding CsgD family transcriptional regulator